MNFFALLVLGGAYATYLDLWWERPSALIALAQWDPVIHGAAGFLLLSTALMSTVAELRARHNRWWEGAGPFLRNCVVLLLGLALLVFISHTVLSAMAGMPRR
jgi:hypothetical protein